MRRFVLASTCVALLGSACVSSNPAVKPAVQAPPSTSTPAEKPLDVDALRPGPGRLPRLATPKGYTVQLRVDPRQERFSGVAELELELPAPTPVIHFHAENMNLTAASAQWQGDVLPVTVTAAPGDAAREAHEQVATLPRAVGPGAVRLRFEYDAPFDAHLSGLYRMNEGEDWYASTQLEPIDARKVFPSLDEPGWKVPFQVSLVVPEGLGAFSNAPEGSRETKDGWTTIRFLPTKPIATYLVAVAVGPFDLVPGPVVNGVPVRGIAPRGRGPLLHDALKLYAQLLPVLEEYFGHPYPYEKADAAAVLEFGAGAMENPGLIIYREEALLIDPRTSSAEDREDVARTVAHELAHQWFGNLVTLSWWDDLWLNEAFAEWMANKALERIGITRADDVLGIREWMLTADASPTAQPIRRPGSGVALGPQFAVATFKGAMVLDMMEQWLGEEAFRTGVRDYIKSRAWGHATSEDLFSALERHAGDKPVREVARTFLDRPGAPQVSADVRCEGSKIEVRLAQARYHALGSSAPAEFPEGRPWKVPACVDVPVDGAVTTRCTLLADGTATLAIDGARSCPAWVHPNSGEHGYYRWVLAPATLRGAAEAVMQTSSAAPTLGRARTALIDQAWAMVAGGALPASDYLDVLERAVASTDDELAIQAVQGYGHVVRTWQGLSATAPFRTWVERTLGPRAKALGWEPRAGESDERRQLRSQLLGTLGGLARTPWVIDGAEARAKRYLKDPASVPPELAGTALSLAARSGRIRAAELEAFLGRVKEPTARLNALTALGSMTPGPELDRALSLLLTDHVRLQDAGAVYTPAMRRRESRDATMAFIEHNWSALQQRLAGFGGAAVGQLQTIVGEYCEAAPRDRARAFFADKKLRAEPLNRNVDESNRCIAVSQAGCEGVARRIDKTGALVASCRAAPAPSAPASAASE